MRQFAIHNPYEPGETEASSRDGDLPAWSTWAQVAFLVAALPAVLLPTAYVTGAGWMVYASLAGMHVFSQQPLAITILLWTGIYATCLQLPIYLCWTMLSQELSAGQRLIWFVIVLLLNMFAIPAFLYAKYRKRTAAWITRSN